MLSIFSACTIGGEEPQGVVTIESTTEISIVDAKSLAERALEATLPMEVRKMIRESLPDSHS